MRMTFLVDVARWFSIRLDAWVRRNDPRGRIKNDMFVKMPRRDKIGPELIEKEKR
jgi:hypothetical protein